MIKFLNLNSEKPYIHFQSLYQEALDNGQKGIEAISVSSYNQIKKEVEARYVNLKYIADNEWIFFSNYHSPKASQFESHSQVSILIYWASINAQIRMKAKIFKTSAKFSDEHFQGRTKEKNALAISSNQSQTIESFDEVAKNFNETLDAMTSETVRPNFWGGYSFIPYYFEFWQGHENRLNKRHAFKQEDDQWTEQLLQP
jgi:pyridoxamine 5'-phosphate oxidase|tara:strand:- start:836 stop:1435 length:600 start_codon:yes stop_codon:yes gene_type:complete